MNMFVLFERHGKLPVFNFDNLSISYTAFETLSSGRINELILIYILYFVIISLFCLLVAAIDLNGRFFGGRVVRAAFYSHEKFLQMKLDEDPL